LRAIVEGIDVDVQEARELWEESIIKLLMMVAKKSGNECMKNHM
jgi:hypothetical protein